MESMDMAKGTITPSSIPFDVQLTPLQCTDDSASAEPSYVMVQAVYELYRRSSVGLTAVLAEDTAR